MAKVIRTTRFRFWLWLIKFIGVIVPRRLRADWRQEWEAELRHRERLLTEWDRLDWRNKLDLLRRSLGAFRDALLLQPRRLEDEMIQDLRYGLRTLFRRPGLTIVAAGTLALGIGANTALFTIVNALLLRPLPYQQPERIVAVWDSGTEYAPAQGTTAPRNFQWWREHSRSFSGLALTQSIGYRLTETAEGASGSGMEVTPNLFAMLGTPAAHGRTLAPGDETSEVKVVVLSHGLWQRSFGADPRVVGRAIQLGDATHTVVGVMPPEFVFPPRVGLATDRDASRYDLWIPLALDNRRLESKSHNYFAYSRLQPGVSLDQAQAEMGGFTRQLQETYPDLNNRLASIRVASLSALTTRQVRPVLSVLFGAVALILLIGCANVANLLLARAAGRSHEIAIRAALGATPGRVLRQILTECAALGLISGLAGLALAYGGLKLLPRVVEVQSLHPVTMNLTVLGFAIALSFVTSLLFGSAAAWQMAKKDVQQSLQEAGRGGAGDGRLGRMRSGLIVAQVALSLVLLAGAGLLIRTLQALLQIDPGFLADHTLTMNVYLPSNKYPIEAAAATYTEILERVRRLPGVLSAGATQRLPIVGSPYGENFQIEGRPMRSPNDLLDLEFRLVTPSYFNAIQMRLLEGRFLAEQDGGTAPCAVVINERLARLYFQQESPIGRRIVLGAPKTGRWCPIVGVVGDTRHFGLDAELKPEVYYSFRQYPRRFMTFVVRTAGDPMLLASSVQAEVRAFDRALTPDGVASMEQIISVSLAQRRLNLLVVGSLAGLALGLAAFGLYGVISYLVAQRTREIGIRMALGAQHRDALWLVLGQGMELTLFGVALGSVAAFALTRTMRSLLFGVSPTDPVTFAVIALSLVSAALLACYLPARRATKIDPLVALRHD